MIKKVISTFLVLDQKLQDVVDLLISHKLHRYVVYCGTFTAKGLKETVGNGKLTIDQEGQIKKFKNHIEQVTFSADYANETGQKVLYITERAVFKLIDGKLTLIEIAPGVDLQKDVLDQMEFKPYIAEDLKLMDARLFTDEVMGLKEE